MQDISLARIDAVHAAIDAAMTFQELKSNLDWLAAADAYARQSKESKETQLQIIEYMLYAERKLGEMIAAAKATGQITHVHNRPKSVVPDENNAFTLEEIGITRKESMRAQRIAAVPKDDFEQADHA